MKAILSGHLARYRTRTYSDLVCLVESKQFDKRGKGVKKGGQVYVLWLTT